MLGAEELPRYTTSKFFIFIYNPVLKTVSSGLELF